MYTKLIAPDQQKRFHLDFFHILLMNIRVANLESEHVISHLSGSLQQIIFSQEFIPEKEIPKPISVTHFSVQQLWLLVSLLLSNRQLLLSFFHVHIVRWKDLTFSLIFTSSSTSETG